MSDQPDMGPLPEMYPRDVVSVAAVHSLEAFLDTWSHEYKLTSAEYTSFLSGAMTRFACRLVAIERRFKPEKPNGDVAAEDAVGGITIEVPHDRAGSG